MGILEEKFRRDLGLRGLSPRTIETYARCCRRFAAHFPARHPLLGRYTHRVGISNSRIEAVAPDGVRFRTKAGGRVTVSPEEFLRRFLLHVLPPGFTKIRHFGLLAAGHVNGRLERARALLALGSAPPAQRPGTVPHTWTEILLCLTGIDVAVCSHCRARAVVRRPLPRPCRHEGHDTSSRPQPIATCPSTHELRKHGALQVNVCTASDASATTAPAALAVLRPATCAPPPRPSRGALAPARCSPQDSTELCAMPIGHSVCP